MKSTQAMRDRIRELASNDGGDDYDRAVLCALDDLDGLLRDSPPYRLLERCRTVLGNMAWERKGFWNEALGRRWPISHEPLRSDAGNLLPLIDAALEGRCGNGPDPMILGACAEARSCQHTLCICEGDPTLLGTPTTTQRQGGD